MRLIDADELLKHKGNCYDENGHLLYGVGTGTILKMPTVDAVPVVRCAECKLHDNCYTEDVFKFAKLNDDKRFCGVGERKGGTNDDHNEMGQNCTIAETM